MDHGGVMSSGEKFTGCSRDDKIRNPGQRTHGGETGQKGPDGKRGHTSPVWALGEPGVFSGGRTDRHSGRFPLAIAWRALSHEAQPPQGGGTGGCCKGPKPASGSGADSQVLDQGRS